MKYREPRDMRCAYETEGAKGVPPEQLRPLFEEETVSGRALAGRYAQSIFGLDSFATTELYLVTVVHVVGIPSPTGGFRPIVEQTWIDTLFGVANDLWAQACIKLVPHATGALVTDFRVIGLSAFAGHCLAPEQFDLVRPYDITVSGTIIVNLYLVEETNGIACGSPITGRVFLPTASRSPEFMGRVFAHEIGHVLLNPLGVDDSDHPDHLMFHPDRHPETTAGSRDGLYLSDCLGAQARAREEFFSFARPGSLVNPGDAVPCSMSPRLGGNLVIVGTSASVVSP